MGSPQATIRPLVIYKRKSLEACQRSPESEFLHSTADLLTDGRSKAERTRSRRFSLPIQVIPEINETETPTHRSSVEKKGEAFSFLNTVQDKGHVNYLVAEILRKAKALEREAYRALFEAEYLRWQAENNCFDFLLDSSVPTALSLKAKELGLRPPNLNSKSTVSLGSSFDQDKRGSSSSMHRPIPTDLNTDFSTPILLASTPSLRPSFVRSPGLVSPLASSSGHLEHEDSELKPILQTGKRTLKKARSRAVGLSKHAEQRSFFIENPLPSKRKFRIKCPFAFLLYCFRRNKYRPCRQSPINIL